MRHIPAAPLDELRHRLILDPALSLRTVTAAELSRSSLPFELDFDDLEPGETPEEKIHVEDSTVFFHVVAALPDGPPLRLLSSAELPEQSKRPPGYGPLPLVTFDGIGNLFLDSRRVENFTFLPSLDHLTPAHTKHFMALFDSLPRDRRELASPDSLTFPVTLRSLRRIDQLQITDIPDLPDPDTVWRSLAARGHVALLHAIGDLRLLPNRVFVLVLFRPELKLGFRRHRRLLS